MTATARLRQRDSQPQPLQPLGAHRLLGLAARRERDQDRAAAGLQHVADGIVAGLRNGQFGRGEQRGKVLAEADDVEAARRLGGSCVEIGLRQVGAGDQAPALGRRLAALRPPTADSTSSLPAAPPPAEMTTS